MIGFIIMDPIIIMWSIKNQHYKFIDHTIVFLLKPQWFKGISQSRIFLWGSEVRWVVGSNGSWVGSKQWRVVHRPKKNTQMWTFGGWNGWFWHILRILRCFEWYLIDGKVNILNWLDLYQDTPKLHHDTWRVLETSGGMMEMLEKGIRLVW